MQSLPQLDLNYMRYQATVHNQFAVDVCVWVRTDVQYSPRFGMEHNTRVEQIVVPFRDRARARAQIHVRDRKTAVNFRREQCFLTGI